MGSRVTMPLADAVLLVIRSLEIGKPDNALALLRDMHRQLKERDDGDGSDTARPDNPDA